MNRKIQFIKFRVNDRVISANGISLENVDYSQAIHVLRECGNTVNLLIKRRALISTMNSTHFSSVNDANNNNLIKITLTKNSKKEGEHYYWMMDIYLNNPMKSSDLGIVLGCKIFIKEIVNRNLTTNGDKENHLQEGDVIQKVFDSKLFNIVVFIIIIDLMIFDSDKQYKC